VAPHSPFKALGEQQLPGVWCWDGGVGAAQLWAGLGPCSHHEAPCHPPVSASCAALS